MLVELTLRVLSSHHDGYCSDNECELNEYIKVIRFETAILETLPTDKEACLDLIPIHIREYIDPDVECTGSGFCDLTDECEEEGLERHDFKYVVDKVEIIESRKAVI